METEERETEKRHKELIEEIEKKGKRNVKIREFQKELEVVPGSIWADG